MTAIQKIKDQAATTTLKFYEVRMSKYRSWIAEMSLRDRVDVVNGQLTITNSLGSVIGTEIDDDVELSDLFDSMVESNPNCCATKAEAIERLIESHKATWFEKCKNSSSKYHQADLVDFEKMYELWSAGKDI